jgi:tetratricopeptide (TPR) repeat protein
VDSRLTQARTRYQEAQAAFERAGDERGRANVLVNLADLDYREDRYDRSRAVFEQALHLLEEQGDLLGQTYAQLGLALVSLAQRREPEFRTHLELAQALARKHGSPVAIEEVARIHANRLKPTAVTTGPVRAVEAGQRVYHRWSSWR